MNPDTLVDGLGGLASPPAIYSRLLEVLGEPDAGSEEVAAVVSVDPGLSARLLRLVNSSFFAFPRPVESVQMAVTIAGTVQVRDLVFATSVVSLFRGIPAGLVDMDGFWRHSLAVGVGARLLAVTRGEYNVESFFLSGLLHDVGRLVLFQEAPEAMREAMIRAATERKPLHRLEHEILGFDHADVGRALVSRWQLGPQQEEVTGLHHDPARAHRYPVEVAAVHVADVMAGGAGWGHSGAPLAPPLALGAWGVLQIGDTDMAALLERVELQWRDAVGAILSPMDARTA